jgi:MFS family permease
MALSVSQLSLFFGIFSLMALSNAIIPILPGLGVALSNQSYLFSAYFFGAMVTTLPGGIISERTGYKPLILFGLILTIVSGLFLILLDQPVILFVARFLEGIGAGFFVAASLSWINQQQEQVSLSGLFMALLNLGLLSGLLLSGWIAGFGYPRGGIILFFGMAAVSLLMAGASALRRGSLFSEETGNETDIPPDWGNLFREVSAMGRRQAPLWFSVIILLGITGFVQAVYPELSDRSTFEVGIVLAVMNFATIIASLTATWVRVEPVLLIRSSAVIMSILVLVFLQYPVSVLLMGFVAGLVMISQMHYLAVAEKHQGIAMGLFSTSSYAGMTFLPAIGGTITAGSSIYYASGCIALLALCSAVFIGKCRCKGFFLARP